MAESLVLLKTKRSSRFQSSQWEDYVKLKVYNFTRHSIDRYYVKDVTSDRFSLFKAQYVQEWNGVVMVYIFQGELRAYRYSFQTRDMLLIARIRTRTIVNLDEMDSHCFLCKDGLLCFGEIIAYYDFSTPAGVALGKYGSQTVCENAFPVSLKGACYRLRLGVYMIYEGRVTFGLFGGNFPEFSFLYPLDAKRVTRIGGRVYGGKPNTVDIIQLDSGHVLDSYEMPQPGVVCAAVSSCDRIYFLWNIYSHALRLNTTNMTIRLFFLGDYFTQCTKVLYLHRKGKLRLPLGLVREICSFIAENKQLAQYLSELKSSRNWEEGVQPLPRRTPISSSTPYQRPRPFSATADKPVSASSTQGARTLQLLSKPAAASTSKLAQKVRIYSPPRNREARSRPKNIPFDKERLYDEAQQLKTRNNTLSDENMRLKTQVSILEREVSRKVLELEEGRGQHLVFSLKQHVKDLKAQLKDQEQENEALKRDIRSTKIVEAEAHVQTLEEECRRLMVTLTTVEPGSSEQRQFQLLMDQNAELKEENTHLTSSLRTAQLELEQAQEDISALEKRLKTRKTKDNPILASEIQKLKHLVEASQAEKTRIETALAHKNGQIEALTRDKEHQLQKAREREQELTAKLAVLEKVKENAGKEEGLEKINEEMIRKVRDLEGNAESLKGKIGSLETEKWKLTEEIEKNNAEIAKLQQNSEFLEIKREKDLESLKNELNSVILQLQNELKTEKQLSNERENAREAVQKELISLNDQILSEKAAAAKEISEKNGAIAHLEYTVTNLRAEVESSKQSEVRSTEELERKIGRLEESLERLLRKVVKKLGKKRFRRYMEGMDWENTGVVTLGELQAGAAAAQIKVKTEQMQGVAELCADLEGKILFERLKKVLKIDTNSESESEKEDKDIPKQPTFSQEASFRPVQTREEAEPVVEEIKEVETQEEPALAEELPQSTEEEVRGNTPGLATPREFLIENEVIPRSLEVRQVPVVEAQVEVSPDTGLNDSDVSRPVAPEPLDEMDGRHEDSPNSSRLDSELHQVLRHISMRFQIHRIPCDELLEQFFGFGAEIHTDVNMRMLKRRLSQPPPSVKEPREQQLVVLLVLGLPLNQENLRGHWDEKKTQMGVVVDILGEKLGKWKIYSEQDEDEFDTFLVNELAPKAEEFRQLCEQRDVEQTEYITEAKFNEVLETLGLNFPADVRHYLSLLFYSQDQLLDMVPYLSLLNAYVLPQSEGSGRNSEEAEVDSGQVLEQQLRLIAKALIEKGLTVRDVLPCDPQGLSRVEDLQTALQTLGFQRINKDAFRLLVESLRQEDSGCILLKDMEEVMASYGVDRLEYSMESLEKRQSGTLSEASPFRSTDFMRISGQKSGGSPMRALQISPIEGGSDRQ